MKAKILKLLIEFGMICDPDELPEIPVCDSCIQFEKELSELLNHASHTMPSDDEIKKACPQELLPRISCWIQGAKWCREFKQSLTNK